MQTVPRSPLPAPVKLLVERARLYHTEGKKKKALDLLQKAIALCKKEHPAEVLPHVLAVYAEHLRLSGQFAEAIRQASEALLLSAPQNNANLQLKIHSEMSYSYQMQRLLPEALASQAKALPLARKLQNAREECKLLTLACWAQRLQGHMEEAIKTAQQAVQAAMRSGHNADAASAYMALGTLSDETGHHDLGLQHHLTALQITEAQGTPMQQSMALGNVGQNYLEQQEYDMARHYLTQAQIMRSGLHNNYINTLSLLELARLHHLSAQPRLAADALHQAHALATAHHPALLPEVYYAQAQQATPQQAVKNFGQAIKAYRQQGNAIELARCLLGAGKCQTILKRYKAANTLLNEALALATGQKSLQLQEQTHQALAELCTATNRPEEALQHYRHHTLYRDQRLGTAIRHRVLLLQMQFDADKKQAEITELQNELNRLKLTAPPNSYALTTREKQVLKLLVEGLSYKQMAECLKLTFETVRSHVTNTYHKLGVSTNTEAVAKAVKEGLV